MTWKKIVHLVAVSACPKCGNAGFDVEPREEIDDPDARIRCTKCGYVGAGSDFLRPVRPANPQQSPRVLQTIVLSDESQKLVLFDWSSHTEARLENLVLLDGAGMFVWAAELPKGTSPDCFVGVTVDAGALSANTWSGYLVTLDMRTGRVLAQQFVK